MKIPFYQVDAFTRRPFAGNPAAVCVLEGWLDDAMLQNIAMENNLSETAFLVKKGQRYDLRWFTPKVEVDLCGHATLGGAYVLFSFFDTAAEKVDFDTASGALRVTRSGDLLVMDFPSRPPVSCDPPQGLADALGAAPQEVLRSRDMMAVFESEEQVGRLSPDFARLAAMEDIFGFIATAPGETADFVSRFFAPAEGIPEDPVTGSAHCTLVPYWSRRLGKTRLQARQISRRGGEIVCEDQGERVALGGRAVLFAQGEIII